MRLAVFSDIHANQMALAICIQYADHIGVDGYVFLGDHVTDCPYPKRTLQMMREAALRRPTWMIRGNREDYLLRYQEGPKEEWKPSSQTGSLLYTYQNLDEADLAFLRRMPISEVIRLPGCPDLCAAHATPINNNLLIYPGSESLENLLQVCPQQTLLSGHSHFQFRYESAGKQFINPGSVGSPSYGQPKAQFALITCQNGRWSARLMNVDYDKEAQIRQFEESGLTHMARMWALGVIKTIREGGRWAPEIKRLARQLAPGEKDIPESVWEEAARRLGVI